MTVKLTKEDLKKALEKHRDPPAGTGDSEYMRALEDENAELHAAMKEGRETVQALLCRVRDLERDYKAARAEAPSGMGALDLIRRELGVHDDGETSLDRVRQLVKAARKGLEAIERGQKVIAALMPGLRHIAVQDYQEVNEAPIAMAQAANGLRDALGLRLPEKLSEEATSQRPKE